MRGRLNRIYRGLVEAVRLTFVLALFVFVLLLILSVGPRL